MALTDYVIMPGTDYQALCDKIREKTGKTDVIKSGDLVTEIEEVADSGGGGNDEWLFAQGSISVTADGTQVITHGLGIIPDIIMVYRSNIGAITVTTNKTYIINGFVVSKKLLGTTGEEARAYGTCFIYNPSSKVFMAASSTMGLEDITPSNYTAVCNVTNQTMTLGADYTPLMAGSTYAWRAYARK